MNKTELWKSPTPIQKRSAEDRLSRAYRGIKSGRWRLVCPMSHSRQAAQGRGHSQVCWPPRLWRWEAPWRRVPPRRWDSFSLDDFSLVLRQGHMHSPWASWPSVSKNGCPGRVGQGLRIALDISGVPFLSPRERLDRSPGRAPGRGEAEEGGEEAGASCPPFP